MTSHGVCGLKYIIASTIPPGAGGKARTGDSLFCFSRAPHRDDLAASRGDGARLVERTATMKPNPPASQVGGFLFVEGR
jgi:hypothetical protein